MILGERIKRIRTFRGLTQRELGLKLGYEERNADVRVAQYESGYRVPKKDTLMEIAKILNVNYINFITEAPGCAEDIMQTFFWLDEDNRNTFHLFQLVRNPGKTIPLTMPLCGTTITTIGLSMPRWECISNMDWLTSSCGNGCCGKRS